MRRRNVAYIRTPDLARLQDTQASQQVGLTGLANINTCLSHVHSLVNHVRDKIGF